MMNNKRSVSAGLAKVLFSLSITCNVETDCDLAEFLRWPGVIYLMAEQTGAWLASGSPAILTWSLN
jgi:hypothetical protein